MEKELVLKLWEVQEQMHSDPEYRDLLSAWESKNQGFLDTVNTLEAETQGVILDYLGYLLELHYKTAEYLLKG